MASGLEDPSGQPRFTPATSSSAELELQIGDSCSDRWIENVLRRARIPRLIPKTHNSSWVPGLEKLCSGVKLEFLLGPDRSAGELTAPPTDRLSMVLLCDWSGPLPLLEPFP